MINIHSPFSSPTLAMQAKQTGITLIEMMISITAASILSLGILSAFSAQSSVFIQQAQRMQSSDDGRQSFEVLSRLIQHSQAGSFNRFPNTVGTDTDLHISFTIPPGFPIWPNLDSTTTPPFNKNTVHIIWANYDNGTNPAKTKVAYQIRIANTSSASLPADTEFKVLAGINTGINTRIAEFDISRVAATQNIRIAVAAKSGGGTDSAITYFDGYVLPRN